MKGFIIAGWSAVFAGWLYGLYRDRAPVREPVSNPWHCRYYGIIAVSVLAAALANHSRSPRHPPKALAIPLTGAFALGIAGYYWARASLGLNWSSEARIAEGHHLVTSGAYRLVRHPIYASKVLMAVSSGLLMSSPPMLALSAALAASAIYQARVEEGMLRRYFPDQYSSYVQRTGMLLPKVRLTAPASIWALLRFGAAQRRLSLVRRRFAGESFRSPA